MEVKFRDLLLCSYFPCLFAYPETKAGLFLHNTVRHRTTPQRCALGGDHEVQQHSHPGGCEVKRTENFQGLANVKYSDKSLGQRGLKKTAVLCEGQSCQPDRMESPGRGASGYVCEGLSPLIMSTDLGRHILMVEEPFPGQGIPDFVKCRKPSENQQCIHCLLSRLQI